MDYEPTEAKLNGLSGEEMAADEAQAAFYEQETAAREEWERQACHHEQQTAWDEDEHAQMLAEVEGY